MKNKNFLVLLMLVSISLSVVFVSCGGGGGGGESTGGDDINPAWVKISIPNTDPAHTSNENELISGTAFISPDYYHCCSGSAEDTGVTVTWKNVTTGASGSANQYVQYCTLLGSTYVCEHYWSALIPLIMGSNEIIVTASDPAYSNIDTLTIIREEAVEDTEPPIIVSVMPLDQFTNVAINSLITITFNEKMDSSTLNTNTITLNSIDGGTVGTVTYVDTTATFSPTTNLSYNTLYTACVTAGIEDLAGNALSDEYCWSFTTSIAP